MAKVCGGCSAFAISDAIPLSSALDLLSVSSQWRWASRTMIALSASFLVIASARESALRDVGWLESEVGGSAFAISGAILLSSTL